MDIILMGSSSEAIHAIRTGKRVIGDDGPGVSTTTQTHELMNTDTDHHLHWTSVLLSLKNKWKVDGDSMSQILSAEAPVDIDTRSRSRVLLVME